SHASVGAVTYHAQARQRKHGVDRHRLASIDVSPPEFVERLAAARATDFRPPVAAREALAMLVGGVVERTHHGVERVAVVARIADHDLETKAGEAALWIVDPAFVVC